MESTGSMHPQTSKLQRAVGDRPYSRNCILERVVRAWTASLTFSALFVACSVYAERLPVESFTLAQGLASNSINKIVRDSRGFVWFCTDEGLSRFDGHQFLNFGMQQGLPGRDVWDIVETKTGDYWAGVNGGLVRISGTDRYRVEVFLPGSDDASRRVLAVKETSDGVLWVGTDGGLYRIPKNSRSILRVDTGPPPEVWTDSSINALEEDGLGNLWFGSNGGVGRIDKAGHVDRWTPKQKFISYIVVALLRDVDGTIWAGAEKGLCHLLREPVAGTSPAQRCYGLKDGLPSPYSQSVHRSADGAIWVGTLEGAAFGIPMQDGAIRFKSVTRRQGLIDDNIAAVAEDAEHNIWLGATNDGAMKLSQYGVALFTEADGLAAPNVVAFIEDRQGALYAVTRSPDGVVFNRFDGIGFRAIRPFTPPQIRAFGSGLQQVALQDRQGQWWIGTGDGLMHYRSGGVEALGTPPAVIVIAPTDGTNVRRLFEDSRGDIWWSTSSRITNTLTRWTHASGKVEVFSTAEGLPSLQSDLPVVFAEDRNGSLWVGFDHHGLVRRRQDGVFEYFAEETSQIGRVRTAYLDANGRLWFGASTGLWRLDDPNAAKPAMRKYTASDGLSSSTVYSLVEDSAGRLYVGTANGLDRLDPTSGQIEHFSIPDGFPTGIIQAAYRDRNGSLWFATRHGATRFSPRDDANEEAPPRVWITAVKVRGAERLVSAAGAASLTGVLLGPDEGQVEFNFAAPNFRTSNEFVYQYRLEGARSLEWSALSPERSVNFASLTPGDYRFLVRAVNPRGVVSTSPAMVEFRILPPFWMTWWFRFAVVLVVAAAAYGLYRYRLTVLLERERLRFRIATDLHDDIGASLSTIAIWSEVAARQAEQGDSSLVQPLERIGAVSREVIDSVSDIVWAISPRHDRFTDLASRMRRHVTDLASGLDFPISFSVEADGDEPNVGPFFRREVFLIFKEALNNVLRHSNCTECSASLILTSGWMTLRIRDNGKGIDGNVTNKGHGLESMSRRAQALGGKLHVESAPSQGTLVELHVPLVRAPNRA